MAITLKRSFLALTRIGTFFDPEFIGYNYFLKSDAFIEALDKEAKPAKSAHVNYHNKDTNSKIYASSDSFDEYDNTYWEAFEPLPDATYYHHTKTQVESFNLSDPTLSLNVGKTA
ncbi:MAG: hypothetical protein IKG21_11275 [Atopobiaceae bacterium]|nr:hypothetical protein [Atopobiaceae bacterium]